MTFQWVAPTDASDGLGRERTQSLRHALGASKARFRNVIGASADGMVVVLRNGLIAFANPAATALLGRAADELLGRVFGIPILAGETTEVDMQRPRGESRVAELRVVETEWEAHPALLVSLHDATERKRLEEELRRHAEQLAEADRRKNEFLAMLAHELRNPLAPILNAAHVMRLSGDDPAVLSRMREVVEHQVCHLARLVDDLLDVSRFTRGKIQLRKAPLDLATVIRQAIEAARPVVESRGHTLSVDITGTPKWLEADPTRLRQILSSLLDNAAKYTDPGGTIFLTALSEGEEVVVKVRDTGIGISAEILPRIFDLFMQADCSLDRSHGGLGIGLTLVKSLVAMHGGTVYANSAGVGQGCAIVVRLPVLTTGPEEAVKVLPPVARSGEIQRHILVVDDNKFSADSLALILQLAGHKARAAYSGPKALEVASAFRPDVVLMDIGLPAMDGFEVARWLRSRADTEGVLLVAVTGYGQEEVLQKAKRAGFDHQLLKPLDLDDLLALLSLQAPGAKACGSSMEETPPIAVHSPTN